jgi:replication factor A1
VRNTKGRIDMEESVGQSSEEQQASVETKIKDLTPQSKRVDVLAKCLDVSEAKDIPGKFGNSRKVAEATVADETGAIILSLWDAQIGSIGKEDVLAIKNGYVSLVRGHMRLNVGKYGQLAKSEKPLDSASTTLNMSDKEYEQERRSFGGGGSRGGSRGGYGGGGRDRRGGYGDRGGDRDSGGDRPSYMNKGRRRF